MTGSTGVTRLGSASTVVLVGNSDALATAALGKAIDEFDAIVRFNGFVLDGFSEHVGTRVTHWALVSNKSTYKVLLAQQHHLRYAEQVEEIWIRRGDAHAKVVALFPSWAADKMRVLPVDLNSRAAALLAGASPTTGLVVLLWLTEMRAGKPVHIAGMIEQGHATHYASPRGLWTGHRVDREVVPVEAWIASGLVKRLVV